LRSRRRRQLLLLWQLRRRRWRRLLVLWRLQRRRRQLVLWRLLLLWRLRRRQLLQEAAQQLCGQRRQLAGAAAVCKPVQLQLRVYCPASLARRLLRQRQRRLWQLLQLLQEAAQQLCGRR
jgi:hypothetical protein